FHAEEVRERRIAFDRPVHEDAAEARILCGVDHLGLADRSHHPLGGGGIGHGLIATEREVLAQRQLGLPAPFEHAAVEVEYVRLIVHCTPEDIATEAGRRVQEMPPARHRSRRPFSRPHPVVSLGRRRRAMARGSASACNIRAARSERRSGRLVAAVSPPMRQASGNIAGASFTHGAPPCQSTLLRSALLWPTYINIPHPKLFRDRHHTKHAPNRNRQNLVTLVAAKKKAQPSHRSSICAPCVNDL